MTFAAFLRAHPEFSSVNPPLVYAMLQEATRRTDPVVFGANTDAAIGWKAASLLDRHPNGGNSKVEPGQQSFYDQELELLREEQGVGFLVAGQPFGVPAFPVVPPTVVVAPAPAPTAPAVVRLTHANSPVGTPWHLAGTSSVIFLVDVSAGTVALDVGLLALQDGTSIEIIDINGAFATNNCTLLDSSGRLFETPWPTAPLTFAAPQLLATSGASYLYRLDATNNRWKLA